MDPSAAEADEPDGRPAVQAAAGETSGSPLHRSSELQNQSESARATPS